MADRTDCEDARYRKWVRWVFDHPVSDPRWFEESGADPWEYDDPAQTVEYLTRLFENALELPARYSLDQISQGLNLLFDSGYSDTMDTLLGQYTPWPERERAIRAMGTVFRDIMAPHCSPQLCSDPEGSRGSTLLNEVCFAWWADCPLVYRDVPGALRIRMTVLEVLQQILRLPSLACQESALPRPRPDSGLAAPRGGTRRAPVPVWIADDESATSGIRRGGAGRGESVTERRRPTDPTRPAGGSWRDSRHPTGRGAPPPGPPDTAPDR